MCGRYAFFLGAKRLAELLQMDIDAGALGPPRYNAAPTARMPVLVAGDARWRLATMTFGWPRGPGGHPPAVINARGETAHRLPMFRSSWASRRAVVLASGFFEWRAGPPPREPYFFSPADQGLWGLAGLWRDDAFVILTRAAQGPVAPIHARMPHILPRAFWAPFLAAPPASMEALPAIVDAALMGAHAVARRGLRPGHDGPDSIAAASPA